MSFWSQNLGGIIGGAIKIGGAIGTGIASKRAARRAMRRTNNELASQEQRATRTYEDIANQDVTQTAVNQQSLTQMQNYLRDARKARAGSIAVTGGSQETIAADKAADNQAVANTIGNMAAQGTAQQMRAKEIYDNTLDGISNARIGNIQQYNADRQNQIAAAGQTINSAGDGFSKSGITGDMFKKG